MKKIFFTLALSLNILSASAFRGLSEINLKLYDNSVFCVVFDNTTYNYYTSNYNFESVTPGSHFISVIRMQPYGYYNTPVTLFSGYINIPANKKMYAMINMYGSYVVISQTQLLGPDDTPYDESYYYNGYENGTWSGSSSYYDDGYSSGYFDYTPYMLQISFMSLISVINNATFESSKIKIASQAINLNFLTSSQVLLLLKCFTFESSKLEIAKLAYSKVIDKENFFKVNEAFTFDSSIDELCEFITGS
ncbi:MAG: DUF4476 domain-containing protein [Bacteroidota bacterium]